MSTLARHVEGYLQLRRALGFKLVSEGVLLAEFVRCAERARQPTVTTEFALEWARRPANASHNYLSRRLRAVRSFARYLHAIDPCCEVPPLELLPAKKYRPAPYLYRDEEIVALMTAASALRPPLRAATFRTLIGLLACTGLRIGEALRLDRDAVDFEHQLLTVRDSKFGKSREVLLHPSTVTALQEYAQVSDLLCPGPKDRSFFITTLGTGSRTRRSTCRSGRCWSRPASRTRYRADTFGFTICATALLSRRCLASIATVAMCKRGCRCYPRIWGTSIRLRRSDTCPRRRSCSRSPPNGSSRPRELSDDRARSCP